MSASDRSNVSRRAILKGGVLATMGLTVGGTVFAADKNLPLITKAIRQAAPKGTQVEFRLLSASKPSVVDPTNPYVQAAAKAMTAVFGNETVFTRSGGSIPVVALLQEELNLPSVMMGFGLPDDNLHAPNERLYLPNFHRGIIAVVKYLESLNSAKK